MKVFGCHFKLIIVAMPCHGVMNVRVVSKPLSMCANILGSLQYKYTIWHFCGT